MLKNNNFKTPFLLAAAAGVTAITWFFSPESPGPNVAFQVGQVSSASESIQSQSSISRLSQASLAPMKTPGTEQSFSFPADSKPTKAVKRVRLNIGYSDVENALMMAKLDHSGSLILDEEAQASLSLVVSRLPVDLTVDDMLKIQSLIRKGLLGEAGEQVADVLSGYYYFKQAEKKWMLTGETPNSLDAAADQLNEMVALREQYLGEDVTQKLFGLQQQQMTFALEVMLIQQDNRLSQEERSSEMESLRQTYSVDSYTLKDANSREVDQLNREIDQLRTNGAEETDIYGRRVEVLGEQAAMQLVAMEDHQNHWQDRYQVYRQEKELILTAAISEKDKQAQIDLLLTTHYSTEELAGAKAYDAQQIH